MVKRIRVALAGNANVGKSVLFNELTGLHQHIGNWPGKTVERAEGTLHYRGYEIDVIDLPGIYSLSTFSIEELISREYIALERPDVVVNVVDASNLERNLVFTVQLLELEAPMVLALNQMDMAKKMGVEIDVERLSERLGVPVVPMVAVKGLGIKELLDSIVDVYEGRVRLKPLKVRYGREVEKYVEKLTGMVEGLGLPYPARWVAVKLLEEDEEIVRLVASRDRSIVEYASRCGREIEGIHGEPCPLVISFERCNLAGLIAREVQTIRRPEKPPMAERLHMVTTHPMLGYIIMLAVLLSSFYAVFKVGGWIAGLIEGYYERLSLLYTPAGVVGRLLWEGLVEGLVAGLTVVLPYVGPFYVILSLLEDSGYLARVAFLMDSAMHKIGLHGKAFIPLMLGYGCNVPACLGCRIMETERERLIAGFVVTLVPCAARTAVILGLVGRYMGIGWALSLYIVNLLVIFLLGRLAFKVAPGEPIGLIMEMPPYRLPSLKVVLRQSWIRVKGFMVEAFPLIVAGSLAVKILDVTGVMRAVSEAFSPVTSGWLGLPVEAGATLIFGILRKELTLVMLAALLGTSDFSVVLYPVQMYVYSLVVMLYVPCIATIAACVREYGWKRALIMATVEVVFAVFVGGVALRLIKVLLM